MPENLFEKIDKQTETIDQVAEKLDGVSIDDLYALAKRTWDYKDYDMAQKYYNHISLLKPLEWKAPYYASLCGCMRSEQFNLWDRRPREVFSFYRATVEYIQGRKEDAQAFVEEATEIFLSVLKEYIRIYAMPENRKHFDEFAPKLKHEIQRAYISVIKELEKQEKYDNVISSVVLDLSDFLFAYCQENYSIVITKEDYEKYIQPIKPEIVYSENVYEEANPNIENEIKLHGKCYLVYKDKVIEQRVRRKNLVTAIILLVSTFLANILPVLLGDSKWLLLALVLILPITTILFLRGFGNSKGYRQDSFLYESRWKYRKTSSGNVICERKTSISQSILSVLSPIIVMVANLLLIMFGGLGIVWAIPALLQVICLVIFADSGISEYDCNRRFEYKGKTYYFDE